METAEEFKEWKRFGQVHNYTEHLIDGLDLRKISNDKICMKSFKISLICFWACMEPLFNKHLSSDSNQRSTTTFHSSSNFYIYWDTPYILTICAAEASVRNANFTMVNFKPYRIVFIKTLLIFAGQTFFLFGS